MTISRTLDGRDDEWMLATREPGHVTEYLLRSTRRWSHTDSVAADRPARTVYHSLASVCGNFAVEWLSAQMRSLGLHGPDTRMDGIRVDAGPSVRSAALDIMERSHELLPRWSRSPQVHAALRRILIGRDVDAWGKAHLWTYTLAHQLNDHMIGGMGPTEAIEWHQRAGPDFHELLTGSFPATTNMLLDLRLVDSNIWSAVNHDAARYYHLVRSRMDAPAFIWSMLVAPLQTMQEWFGSSIALAFVNSEEAYRLRLLQTMREEFITWTDLDGREGQLYRLMRLQRLQAPQPLHMYSAAHTRRSTTPAPPPPPPAPPPPAPRVATPAKRTMFGRKIQVVTQGASVTIEAASVPSQSENKEKPACSPKESGSDSRPSKSHRMAFRRSRTPRPS